MISHKFVAAFQRVHIGNVPWHFPHPKPHDQVSSEIWVTNRVHLQEGLSKRKKPRNNSEARKMSEAQHCLSLNSFGERLFMNGGWITRITTIRPEWRLRWWRKSHIRRLRWWRKSQHQLVLKKYYTSKDTLAGGRQRGALTPMRSLSALLSRELLSAELPGTASVS